VVTDDQSGAAQADHGALVPWGTLTIDGVTMVSAGYLPDRLRAQPPGACVGRVACWPTRPAAAITPLLRAAAALQVRPLRHERFGHGNSTPRVRSSDWLHVRQLTPALCLGPVPWHCARVNIRSGAGA
jgi:hypothetical protein